MDLHRALDIWEQAGEGDKMKRRIKKGWCQTVLMPELIDEKPSFFQLGMAKAPKRRVNTDWVCLGGRDRWRSRRECSVWRWFGAYPGKRRKGGCVVVKAKKTWGVYLFLRVMHLHPCWAEARWCHIDFNSPQRRFHLHLCKDSPRW